jgi:hypothetical protein
MSNAPCLPARIGSRGVCRVGLPTARSSTSSSRRRQPSCVEENRRLTDSYLLVECAFIGGIGRSRIMRGAVGVVAINGKSVFNGQPFDILLGAVLPTKGERVLRCDEETSLCLSSGF